MSENRGPDEPAGMGAADGPSDGGSAGMGGIAGGGRSVAPPQARAARSGTGPVAWLALLLVLGIAAAAVYLVLEAQRREAELLQRLGNLEASAGQGDKAFEQLRTELERGIALALESQEAGQLRVRETLETALAVQQRSLERAAADRSSATERAGRALDERLGELNAQLRELQQSSAQLREAVAEQLQRLDAQQRRLEELSPVEPDSWQLARVRQQLELASRSLILNRDSEAAARLLQNAEGILSSLNNPAVQDLQGAVASDLAALRALSPPDSQGIYRRLGALLDASGDLQKAMTPPREFVAKNSVEGDWRTRLAEGYRAALAKLSDFVVIRRNEEPVEAMLSAQYSDLLRENLRLLIEQAQLAVLSANQPLYALSIGHALDWLAAFDVNDQAPAMRAELEALAGARIAAELPELDDSLGALDALMQALADSEVD